MGRAIFTGIILMVVLGACTKNHPDSNTCTTCPATVSFKADIIPIFSQNCATTTTCHHGSNASSGHFNLDSAVAYSQATMSGTGYIIAGNANGSILYDQLLSTGNPHMPVGVQLDNCTIQKIYCWIEQGANNN